MSARGSRSTASATNGVFRGSVVARDGVSEFGRTSISLIVRVIEGTLERHRYETELEHQNDQLEKFASRISHDLRNPLTVADEYLELANETGGDEYFMMLC